MSDELYRLTGVEQRVLSRKAKQTIKKLLESLLEDNQIHWWFTIRIFGFFLLIVLLNTLLQNVHFSSYYTIESKCYQKTLNTNNHLKRILNSMGSLIRKILTWHHTFSEHVATTSKYSIYYFMLENQRFTDSGCWL